LPTEKKDAVKRIAISRLPVLTTLSFLTFVLFFCSPALAQSQPLGRPPGEVNLPDALEPSLPAAAQFHGTVSGRIVDQTGNGIAGADLTLLRDQEYVMQEVQTDDDGQFTFAHVPPGPLQLTIVAEGFTAQMVSGTLLFGENYVFPQITLFLATQTTEIYVSPSREEIAQEQFKRSNDWNP
jgi:hypothetical protein